MIPSVSFATTDLLSNYTTEKTYAELSNTTSTTTATKSNSIIVGLALNQGAIATLRYVYYSILVVVILTGNLLTIWAVATTDRLRVKSYTLTTSLAATDFVFGLLLLNFVAHEAAARTACDLATFRSAVRPIERLALYASFMHITVIALDRFVAIIYSLHYEIHMNSSMLRRIVIAVWIFAGAVSMPPYLGFAQTVVRPQSCIVTLWPFYETVVEMLIYFMNCLVVVFVYVRIWSTAMRHENMMKLRQIQAISLSSTARPSDSARPTGAASAGEPHGASRMSEPQTVGGVVVVVAPAGCGYCQRTLIKKYRATRTVMVVLASYILLWSPYIISRLLGIVTTGKNEAIKVQLFQTMAGTFCLTNFGINFLIYAVTNKDFRRAFQRILRCRANVIEPSSSSATHQ